MNKFEIFEMFVLVSSARQQKVDIYGNIRS